MNGAHDLGGMHGFGAIDRSVETHFPNRWEERVFGLTLACGMLGHWNLDMARFARERMAPAHYLNSTYYEHWLFGLELLLQERGLVSQDELDSGQAEGFRSFEPVAEEKISDLLRKGGPTAMIPDSDPLYRPGDQVTIINEHPHHHTRMPRYIRGCRGEVVSHHGAHIFPDTHATSGEKIPHHLYGVRFEGETLWGATGSESSTAVYVDVFEPYISRQNT